MDTIEIHAFNIIKGEQNGDEFLWDHPYYDKETGMLMRGAWKSSVEQKK